MLRNMDMGNKNEPVVAIRLGQLNKCASSGMKSLSEISRGVHPKKICKSSNYWEFMKCITITLSLYNKL